MAIPGRRQTTRHSLDVRQVAPAKNPVVAVRREHYPAARSLLVAMLEQQRAAGNEVATRLSHDCFDRVDTVRAGGQSGPRLEAQVALSQMRVAVRDVGRIGHDEVETAVAQRRKPLAFDE